MDREVTEAVTDSDRALVRAIGLLAAEAKPGMDRNPLALQEALDLVIEARRDLGSIRDALQAAGIVAKGEA